MARKELSEQERQQIKTSLEETRKRRKNQFIKVVELKVNCHHTSKETYKLFNQYFKEAKWVYNDMLSASQTRNIFDYTYTEHKEIQRLDKDKNSITEKVTIPSVYHRAMVKQVKTNISNLSKAKKKGIKIGKLNYKSEVNSIPIITGFIKIKDNTHITIPAFSNLKVYGLDQLDKYTNYEIADGKLIRKSSGIYIKITVCIDKKEQKTGTKKTYKDVGLDFGIKDNIITSDGEKFNCNVRETEQLKFLQKQLHRKQEGSKRYYRLRSQINREYEKIENRKNDASNKLISYFNKHYDIVYFQDEQIANWIKVKHSKHNGRKCGFSFGRQVQSSYLGRVKAELKLLEPSGESFMISKWLPTTKFCPRCGSLNAITLGERTYHCDCGYSCDRDIHAAGNIKLFGSIKRAECLEQASAERVSSISEKLALLAIQKQEALDEAKKEAASL
jgi:putative transposase